MKKRVLAAFLAAVCRIYGRQLSVREPAEYIITVRTDSSAGRHHHRKKQIYVARKDIDKYNVSVADFISDEYLVIQQLRRAATSAGISLLLFFTSMILVIRWSSILTRPLKKMQEIMDKPISGISHLRSLILSLSSKVMKCSTLQSPISK